MNKYVIGLDFGTNSCRSSIFNISNGDELASDIFAYPSGEAGVIVDPSAPNLARQNPFDYLEGIEVTITNAVKLALQSDAGFSPQNIIGIGIDTTGSSPMPVDENGNPLCYDEKFKNDPAALVWLWKDHTSYAEAQMITEQAAKDHPEYLSKIGGVFFRVVLEQDMALQKRKPRRF
jgi:L-ribulokinase